MAAAAAEGGAIAALSVQLLAVRGGGALRDALSALGTLADASPECRTQLAAAVPELRGVIEDVAARGGNDALAEAAARVLLLADA